ncbi:10148_t:CDS:2, partial [Acaulospora morrowiae]
MVPSPLPPIVRETCKEFAFDYSELQMEVLSEKLVHYKSWKGDEILVEVTKGILSVLTVLKIFPLGNLQKQSIASADRRGEGHSGRRPDIKFCGEKLMMEFFGPIKDVIRRRIIEIKLLGVKLHLNVLIRDSGDRRAFTSDNRAGHLCPPKALNINNRAGHLCPNNRAGHLCLNTSFMARRTA